MADYLRFCEQTAREAGVVLMEKFGKVVAREKGPADLVTEADFASQELVMKRVNEIYPDHLIVGEESVTGASQGGKAEGGDSAPLGGKGARWIIDPLDGTANFVHRVPHFAVSLALELEGKLEAATIFNPARDESFTAAAGQGARLNEEPIRTSGETQAAQALVAVGFPPASFESEDLTAFLRALPVCQGMRRTGSAALNMAFVACGRFDAVWSYGTSIWDMAAGVLIVQEAGGVVSDPDGGPVDLETGRFLASATESLHQQLLDVLNKES